TATRFRRLIDAIPYVPRIEEDEGLNDRAARAERQSRRAQFRLYVPAAIVQRDVRRIPSHTGLSAESHFFAGQQGVRCPLERAVCAQREAAAQRERAQRGQLQIQVTRARALSRCVERGLVVRTVESPGTADERRGGVRGSRVVRLAHR